MSNQLSRKALLPVILLAFVASPIMGQQRRPSSNSYTQSSDSATTVFRAARDLITDGEWSKAQDKFSEYVSKYPNEKNLDAAYYWLAYSQYKLAKYQQCRETVNRLFEKYQDSVWLDDARLLLAQVPGVLAANAAAVEALRVDPARVDQAIAVTTDARRAVPMMAPPAEPTIVYAPGATTPLAIGAAPMPGQVAGVSNLGWETLGGSDNDDDPCEFKIVVLQALFQTDVQRGIVAATDWLKPGSTQTTRCKSAALTLLGRHGGKAVTPVILNLARNETDVKLRARAISTLGAINDDSVIDSLREFALNSTDNEIVEASLYALNQHTTDRVIGVLTEIATSGKTTAQRRAAINSISVRPGDPAVDALFKIYEADQSVEIRKAVINGFANRRSERAAEKLFEIARTADNVELRKAAISNIPRRGGDKAIDFLIALYDSEKNEELKDQILNSFGSGTNLISRTPRPGQVSGGDLWVAQGPAYTNRSPVAEKKVIRKLIDIAKNQQESMTRRKRAIGWLSRSNDPDVQKFLEELLRQ